MKTIGFRQAAELLRQGAVGVLPTDTLFGLVCVAGDHASVTRLYQLKSREKKPGTLIGASVDQLVELGLKRRYLDAVSHYWPNPISVVIPCATTELNYLHLGKQSIAVRLPDNDELQKLLEQTGPLLTSSANLPDQPPAHSAVEAEQYFGDKVDFYVGDAIGSLQKPSTVLQVIDDTVVVLRDGAAIIDEETGAIE